MQEAQSNTTRKNDKAKKAPSRVEMIDTETGEVLDGGKLFYLPPKMRIKGFFMADQNGFETLAKSKLNGEAFKVLMLLMSRMDFENAIAISPKEIGEVLVMKKQNVGRAMKALREAGVFEAKVDHIVYLDTHLT